MPDKSKLLSWLGLQKAGGEDIELPSESGRVDPRLKKPNVGAALKKAGEGYKQLMKTTERLKQHEKAEEKD